MTLYKMLAAVQMFPEHLLLTLKEVQASMFFTNLMNASGR